MAMTKRELLMQIIESGDLDAEVKVVNTAVRDFEVTTNDDVGIDIDAVGIDADNGTLYIEYSDSDAL